MAFGGTPGFEQPGFDDASFSTGDAPFGAFVSCPLPVVRTTWSPSTDLLVRKTFTPRTADEGLSVSMAIDNDVQVFINGVDISGGLRPHDGCASRNSFIFPIPPSVLTPGPNLLAVHGRRGRRFAWW